MAKKNKGKGGKRTDATGDRRCATCGQPVQFRRVGGKGPVRPIGCRCPSGQSLLARPVQRVKRPPVKPALVGRIPWPMSRRTRCFWCPAMVFFHTNGTGDCVLLDELHPPWPVHGCWALHRERAQAIRSLRIPANEPARHVPTPYWFAPEIRASDWSRMEPNPEEPILPPPPSTINPGPFQLCANVKWPESELYDLRAAVECDLHWSLVVTTAALSVGIPHTLRSRFRPGDPFVAEVFTVETPRGQTYLASRLQLPNGISGQVFDPFPVRYFAYGSNMDPQQMHERVSNARFIGRARLPGYRLAFTRVSTKWKAGVADVLADPNDEVWGVLYAMTKNDLHKLDRFEGYPTAYNRLEVDVGFDPDLEPVRAWAYVVAHPNVQTVPPPRRDYMRSIVDGARDAGLPESWLARLAAIETVD